MTCNLEIYEARVWGFSRCGFSAAHAQGNLVLWSTRGTSVAGWASTVGCWRFYIHLAVHARWLSQFIWAVKMHRIFLRTRLNIMCICFSLNLGISWEISLMI